MDPTSDPTKASKPLKILTIDGGGLQGVSTLLILNEVLDTIAKQNGVRKPRPCDVFDTIAGIGAGGWLAILLGRFRMDINSCLCEWYKIVERIAPRSKSKELRLRILQHCYFDTHRLVEQVEKLTKLYGRGEYLFEPNPERARTRHVIVAALKSDTKGYNIFRSYKIPNSAKFPERLREGPANPSKFKISSAFGVTGASKYFTPEWKEQMESSGGIKFRDAEFPKPHNITELALDEMWAIYGTDVPISVVVNVGPGLPNNVDVKQIARRFSWGLDTTGDHTAVSIGPSKTRHEKSSNEASGSVAPPDDVSQDANKVLFRIPDNSAKQNSTSTPAQDTKKKGPTGRTNTFGSIKGRSHDAKLKRRENEIEQDIKGKLNNLYPSGSELYYRLAPAYAPQGTAQNDSAASGVAFEAIRGFLNDPSIHSSIGEVAERVSQPITVV